jgi:hypothetical protein
MFVCVKSRLSGRIFRYPFGYYDSIVRLLRREYKQEQRQKRWATFERLHPAGRPSTLSIHRLLEHEHAQVSVVDGRASLEGRRREGAASGGLRLALLVG